MQWDLEAKWTDSRSAFPAACRSAVMQINEKKYAEKIENDGYRTVLKYGIAFYRKEKECLAVCDNIQQQ